MLTCEGYRMFQGTATVTPVARPAFDVTGTWLYKPEYRCWYVNGSSYPADIVGNFREAEMDKEDIHHEVH